MQKNEKKSPRNTKNSLNQTVRKRNYSQMNYENRELFERLRSKQSHYSANNYANDRKVIENRLLMISQFKKKHQKNRPHIKKKLNAIVDIRRLVYKKGIYLEGRGILIEIYKYPENIRIFAIDGESSDTYRLIISNADAFEFMKGSLNWEIFLKCLNIENGALVLEFP